MKKEKVTLKKAMSDTQGIIATRETVMKGDHAETVKKNGEQDPIKKENRGQETL